MTVARWLSVSVLLLLVGIAAPAQAINVPGDFPTIQAAIQAIVANPALNGSVVNVAPGHYFEALQINNTPRSFTIRGAGNQTVIRGNGGGFSGININNSPGAIRIEALQVLAVPSNFLGTGGGFTVSNSSPTFSGVRFEGNFAAVDGGGGILTNTNSLIENCVFVGNQANRFAGGVLVSGGAPTFVNTTIQNNRSGVSQGIGSGGGVHVNSASPTFRSSRIINNQAMFAGGGIVAIGPGAPITLTLEDSEVSGNVATPDPASTTYRADGGGILIEGSGTARLIRTAVRNNAANSGGGLAGTFAVRYELTGSIVEGNQAFDPAGVSGFGGGIVLVSPGPAQPGTVVLTDSVVRNNAATSGGGILSGCQALALCVTLTISNSVIANNSAQTLGGGVHASRTNLTISGSQILGNTVTPAGNPAGPVGGGVLIAATAASITGTTIAGNVAKTLGGGVYIDQGSTVSIDGSRIYGNSTQNAALKGGGGIFVANTGPPSGSVTNSVIADNDNFQIREEVCPGSPAPTAPILIYFNNQIRPKGSNIDYYNAPCFPPFEVLSIGAFNNLSASKTVGNTNPIPGFVHFAATPDKATSVPGVPALPSVLAWTVARATSVTIDQGVGAGLPPTSLADVLPTCPTPYTLTSNAPGGPVMISVMGSANFTQIGPGFMAYTPGFTGGVSVAYGTVGGQPVIVTGAGPGGAAHVRVLRIDGSPVAELLPYALGFTGGANVAFAANIGGQPAVITGAGPGGSPHVRVLRLNGASVAEIVPYPLLFAGGVTVGFVQNLGGSPAIVTAPGPGGGPHVRVFNVDGSPRGGGIFVYPILFSGGVTFAVGDVTGDGNAELVTAPGPGGGPHVRLFNVDANGNFTDVGGGGFFAYEVNFSGGVSIAVGNVDGLGNRDLITARGSGPPLARVYNVNGAGAATAFAESFVYDAAFTGGVRLAAGNIDGDAKDEIITAPGPGGGPHIKMFKFPCP